MIVQARTGCRPLRPSEHKHLRSIVCTSDDAILLREHARARQGIRLFSHTDANIRQGYP